MLPPPLRLEIYVPYSIRELEPLLGALGAPRVIAALALGYVQSFDSGFRTASRKTELKFSR